MYKIANVPRCNTLKIVVNLMYLGLDEKIYIYLLCTFFLLQPFKSAHRKKTSSTNDHL